MLEGNNFLSILFPFLLSLVYFFLPEKAIIASKSRVDDGNQQNSSKYKIFTLYSRRRCVSRTQKLRMYGFKYMCLVSRYFFPRIIILGILCLKIAVPSLSVPSRVELSEFCLGKSSLEVLDGLIEFLVDSYTISRCLSPSSLSPQGQSPSLSRVSAGSESSSTTHRYLDRNPVQEIFHQKTFSHIFL